MSITRREMCCLPPALLPARMALPAFAAPDESLSSGTFVFDKMPVQALDHAEVRRIMKGKLATGESVEVHESTLPNVYPHAAHPHAHSERWLDREGAVQLTINRTNYLMGPGGLGFVNSNQGTRDQECWESSSDLHCGCHRSRSRHAIVNFSDAPARGLRAAII
jgi:hypothetical protein